ncbi:MAG: hypothetical protein ACXAC2_19230 [Candidatus Kariarchaeaceae archaeon]|jgi:hypothetical protein
MRQCQKCEESDFEFVYGSVWKCKNCGTLSGNMKDLEEFKKPIQKKTAEKKKRKSYQQAKITCDICKTVIFVMKYPEEQEFKKLQAAWKKHQCKTVTEHYT